MELDPALERQPDEPLIVKQKNSCFYGTNLAGLLIGNKVDTLIITGCSTSACVRLTAVDAFNYGFHVIIPEKAVGDRDLTMGTYALIDIDLKFGDVVPVETVVEYLAKFRS